MLVLSRKVEETIFLGEDIEIVVIEVKGGRVRLGVRAPQSVRICRGELRAETRAKNVRAASSNAADAEVAEQIFRDF